MRNETSSRDVSFMRLKRMSDREKNVIIIMNFFIILFFSFFSLFVYLFYFFIFFFLGGGGVTLGWVSVGYIHMSFFL